MGRQIATRIAAAGFPLTVWNRSPAAADAAGRDDGGAAAALTRPRQPGTPTSWSPCSPTATRRSRARDAGRRAGRAAPGRGRRRLLDHRRRAGAGRRPQLCASRGRRASSTARSAGARSSPARGARPDGRRGRGRARPGPAGASSFGGTIVHVGPTGAGAAAKVAVNGLLHTFSAALAESPRLRRGSRSRARRCCSMCWHRGAGQPFLGYKRDAFLDPDRRSGGLRPGNRHQGPQARRRGLPARA